MPQRLFLIPDKLPCVPCPHQTVCCSWGVPLTPVEAEELTSRYGPQVVRIPTVEEYQELGDDPRTVVVDGRCVFNDRTTGACRLHETDHYPSDCRNFPWTDGQGGAYPWAVDICPEIGPAKD
jgi:Fe-S-cluster containining protein